MKDFMQSLPWQTQLANAIKHPQALLDYVELNANQINYSELAIKQFPVLIPHVFANRIRKNDPYDPILRQVFPYIDEEKKDDNFTQDPLNEYNVQPVPGLLKKYDSRILSITTGACAVHCRYCFRRHFPYKNLSSSLNSWKEKISYIQSDHTIKEIILSGGDPLSLSDRRLIEICKSIAKIKHIKRIRFHTRIPIVLPARLSFGLLEKLTDIGKNLIFVLHVNHANEIDNNVVKSLELLNDFNIPLLNQSVLLKGINDSVTTLINLSERLIGNNIIPYYLHLLDPVAGTTFFNVNIEHARSLVSQMHKEASGYLIPKLVKEESQSTGKKIIHYPS